MIQEYQITLHVSRVAALHNHARPSAGMQQRMMNAYSPVQEAVATSWPVPLPLRTAHNHAPGVNVMRCIAIPSDANKVAPEVSAI